MAAADEGDDSCQHMAEQVPKIEQIVHTVKSPLPLDCSWWDLFHVHVHASFSSKLVPLSCKNIF